MFPNKDKLETEHAGQTEPTKKPNDQVVTHGNIYQDKTVINPSRAVYSEGFSTTLKDKPRYKEAMIDLEKQKTIALQREMEELKAIDQNFNEAYKTEVAKYKFSRDHGLLHDLGVGVVTAIMKGRKIDYEPKSITEGSFIEVRLSIKELKGLMFGSLIDGNGETIRGYGGIIADNWRHVAGYFHKPIKDKDGEDVLPKDLPSMEIIGKDWLSWRRPILLRGGKTILKGDGSNNTVDLLLDKILYPVNIGNKEKLSITDGYICQVAGLSSFLEAGKQIYQSKNKGVIHKSYDTSAMRSLIIAIQSAYTLDKVPCRIKREVTSVEQTGDIVKITFNRKIIDNIYPKAGTEKRGYSYGDFIKFVKTTFNYYLEAFNEFDIKPQAGMIVPMYGKDYPAEYDYKGKKGEGTIFIFKLKCLKPINRTTIQQ